ncbi:LysR family transcriptional regulator [Bradyrhizobium sp. U531]
MDRLRQLEVFARIAELGSLSKAAEILRMSNAAASGHLSSLDERLAVRLIDRNTRQQWLTEAGQELLQRCVPEPYQVARQDHRGLRLSDTQIREHSEPRIWIDATK